MYELINNALKNVKKINIREIIRRILKIVLIFSMFYLTLLDTNKLNQVEIVKIVCINAIVFSIIDTIFPSIY
jgi:hypothetical protein